MKLKALFIASMLVLTGCGINDEKADETPEEDRNRTEIQQVENSAYQSIVQIVAPGLEGHGTGFLIGNHKILTNKHVVDSFEEGKMMARVKNDSGETFDYQVKKVTPAPDDEVDLAIIEVSPNEDGQAIDDDMKFFELASPEEIKRVEKGDAVNTVGYPGDKNPGTLWDSKGKVLTLGGNFLTYDAFISGGNSGSPLFNEAGKVIGLSNASNNENGIRSFGFLLTDEVYRFIEENR